MPALPQDVLTFWSNAGPGKWFKKDRAFDDAIALKFEPVHHRAARGEYDDWIASAEGCLALVILLDQFPRNLYRGSAHAFATDGKARFIADQAVSRGFDRQVAPELRAFFYLPFEHSEAMDDQLRAVALCTALRDDTGDTETLKFAELHRQIIQRFGRFPHRNVLLGRESSLDELAFLDAGGFAG